MVERRGFPLLRSCRGPSELPLPVHNFFNYAPTYTKTVFSEQFIYQMPLFSAYPYTFPHKSLKMIHNQPYFIFFLRHSNIPNHLPGSNPLDIYAKKTLRPGSNGLRVSIHASILFQVDPPSCIYLVFYYFHSLIFKFRPVHYCGRMIFDQMSLFRA